MKNLMVLVLLVVFLNGCDLLGSGSSETGSGTPPVPETTWGNMVPIANTYTISTSSYTPQQYMDYGQVAATSNAICAVIWQTATSVFASCRNTALDGQWPVTCTADAVTGVVACGVVSNTLIYFATSLGIPRDLSIEEAELADEIRRQTYCDAPRIDGSASPCVIS